MLATSIKTHPHKLKSGEPRYKNFCNYNNGSLFLLSKM